MTSLLSVHDYILMFATSSHDVPTLCCSIQEDISRRSEQEPKMHPKRWRQNNKTKKKTLLDCGLKWKRQMEDSGCKKSHGELGNNTLDYLGWDHEQLNHHLSWHMHQQHGSNGSLSLTITLFWPMQSVSLQHSKQVLLPADENIQQTAFRTHSPLLHRNWNNSSSKDCMYPWPPLAANISWKGNCRWRSRSMTSTQFGSPGLLSNS